MRSPSSICRPPAATKYGVPPTRCVGCGWWVLLFSPLAVSCTQCRCLCHQPTPGRLGLPGTQAVRCRHRASRPLHAGVGRRGLRGFEPWCGSRAAAIASARLLGQHPGEASSVMEPNPLPTDESHISGAARAGALLGEAGRSSGMTGRSAR